jgi:FhuF 2Fe-2S C-terminal domain
MSIEIPTETLQITPAESPLAAALAAQGVFWPEPRVDVGPLEPGWMTAASLFANHAAIEDQLAYQASFFTRVDRKSSAAFLLSDYLSMFCVTAVPPLVGDGMVPDFAPDRYAMKFYSRPFEHDGRTAVMRRAHVRFLSDAVVAQGGLGDVALHTAFRDAAIAHLTPLVETLNARTGLPRSAMWRLVADALAVAFLDAGRRHERLDEAKAAAMAVLKHPGSPLTNRQLHYFDVTLRDDACPDRVLASYTFRARGGCCRFYRAEGGHLCSTCVLQTPAERERILKAGMRRKLGLPAA